MTIFSGHPVFSRVVFVLALTNLAAGLIYLLTTLYPAGDTLDDRQIQRNTPKQREAQSPTSQVTTVSGHFMGKTANTVTVERTPTFSDDSGQVTGTVTAATQYALISFTDFSAYWCRWYQTLDLTMQRVFPAPYPCGTTSAPADAFSERPAAIDDIAAGDYLILSGTKNTNTLVLTRVWLIRAPATSFPYLGIDTQNAQ